MEGAPVSEEPAIAQGLDLPRLSDQINFTNGLSGQTRNLLPRLSGCYLASDREQARAMADAYPDRYFLLVDGQCYNGRMLTGGRKKASGPLVLKREMREYAALLLEQERALEEKTREQEALQRETTALEAELERLRQLQQTSEKDAVSLDHDIRRTAEEIHRSNSRISVARLELERLAREEERAHEKRAENQTLVEQKDSERGERELALDAMREQLDAAQLEAQRISEEHSVLRARLAALEERHRGERAALAKLETQSREMSERREQIAGEMARWGENRARILTENIELDQKLTALGEQIVVAERSVLELSEQEARQRDALAAADEVLRDLRARIENGACAAFRD